jgi:hypothetical protein
MVICRQQCIMPDISVREQTIEYFKPSFPMKSISLAFLYLESHGVQSILVHWCQVMNGSWFSYWIEYLVYLAFVVHLSVECERYVLILIIPLENFCKTTDDDQIHKECHAHLLFVLYEHSVYIHKCAATCLLVVF